MSNSAGVIVHSFGLKRIKGEAAEAVNSIEKSAYMAAYQAPVHEGDTACGKLPGNEFLPCTSADWLNEVVLIADQSCLELTVCLK
jgi:hypothetical protein